jgi:hypothetical protein
MWRMGRNADDHDPQFLGSVEVDIVVSCTAQSQEPDPAFASARRTSPSTASFTNTPATRQSVANFADNAVDEM